MTVHVLSDCHWIATSFAAFELHESRQLLCLLHRAFVSSPLQSTSSTQQCSLSHKWNHRSHITRAQSSQFLPVAATSSPGSTSRESSSDDRRKLRQNDPPKRRSTMNSREAAYDEEEQLRRAIEESKEEARMSHDDAGSRRPKRGRTDSEA